MGHKTFTSLSFVDLYDKDKTVRDAKLSSYADSSSFKEFSDSYFEFKRSYRGRFSKRYLDKYNIEYKSDIDTSSIDNDKLLQEIQEYDSLAYSIYTTSVSVNNLSILSLKFLQDKYNDEFDHKFFSIITKYDGSNSDDLCCSGADGIVECKCCEDNDDCDNEDCDDEDNQKTCKAIYDRVSYAFPNLDDDPLTDDDYDTIEVTLASSLNDDIEPIVHTFDNDYKNVSVYVQYRREDSDDLYYYIIDLYDNDSVVIDGSGTEMLPIIPLKEDNVVSTEKKTTRKLLRKYALSPDNLIETLDNPDLDNMYLMSGVRIRDIYFIYPRTYTSTEAESFPVDILRKAEYNDDETEVTISQELSDWWLKKNRIKRSKYLKFVGDIIESQDPGTTSFSTHTLTITTTLNYESEIVDGAVSGSEKKDGSIRVGASDITTVYTTEEHDLAWFLGRMQYIDQSYYSIEGSHKESFDKGNAYEYYYTLSDLISLDEGETLTVKSRYISLKTQLNATQYRDIHIASCEQITSISGHKFIRTTDISNTDTSEYSKIKSTEPRLLIPLDIMNSADFTTYSVVKEYGTFFLAYAIKVVKTHWYDKFLGLIISLFIAILTGGASLVVTITNFVVNTVISFIISKALELIKSPLLRSILSFIVTGLGNFQNMIQDLTKFTSEAFLKLASEITSFASSAMDIVNSFKAQDMKDEEERNSLLESARRNSENSDTHVLKADLSSTVSAVDSQSPDALYSTMYDGPYNYESLFDSSTELNTRVNIVAG
jgi:hypothetical protein